MMYENSEPVLGAQKVEVYMEECFFMRASMRSSF